MTASPESEPTTEPTTTEPPAAAVTPPAPEPAETPKPEAPKAEAKANPWDDPEAAKAEIERLRKENGAARTNAKAQAAEDAKKELAQTIGKALGLVEEEAIDPAKLTESLTTAQAEAKQAQVALAVYQSAGPAGGDPVALLDSTTFLKQVAAIDPTDTAAVAAAIQSAVEANPRLGAAPADPRAPKPNPAQGSSATATPTPEDLAAQAAASGDWKASAALKAEHLLALRKQSI